jgi:GxxExxY protein
MAENDVAREIADAAYRIHRMLGTGLFESVYEKVQAYELRKRGLAVLVQRPIPVVYEDVRIDEAFRADLIVQGIVIVELKSIQEIAPIHKKQLLTYLRLSGMKLGLLINFNVEYNKDGIVRTVNCLE